MGRRSTSASGTLSTARKKSGVTSWSGCDAHQSGAMVTSYLAGELKLVAQGSGHGAGSRFALAGPTASLSRTEKAEAGESEAVGFYLDSAWIRSAVYSILLNALSRPDLGIADTTQLPDSGRTRFPGDRCHDSASGAAEHTQPPDADRFRLRLASCYDELYQRGRRRPYLIVSRCFSYAGSV